MVATVYSLFASYTMRFRFPLLLAKISAGLDDLPIEVTQICIPTTSEFIDLHVLLRSLVLHLLTYKQHQQNCAEEDK